MGVSPTTSVVTVVSAKKKSIKKDSTSVLPNSLQILKKYCILVHNVTGPGTKHVTIKAFSVTETKLKTRVLQGTYVYLSLPTH